MNIGAALILTALAAWQVHVHIGHLKERSTKYAAAREYADSVEKPLLVVGGPWGSSKGYLWRRWLYLPAHGSGDVCVDQDLRACDGAPESMAADIRDIPFPDGYFGAAFCSHILEHLDTVDDCVLAVKELERVADALFVAAPTKQSIPAWISSSHHLWAWQEDGTILIQQRNWPPWR